MYLGMSLNIQQVQKLVMTPELKQSIQILQYNYQELNQFINEQVLINPVIEVSNIQEGEFDKTSNSEKVKTKENDIDWKEYFKDYDDISYRQINYSREKEDVSFEQFVSTDTTLTEHLLFQLQFLLLKDKHKGIGKYIIESLDENGYLNMMTSDIAKFFLESEETIENILAVIQTFDPLGVGARDLKECLLIQIKQREVEDEMVSVIVSKYLNEVAENKIMNISKSLEISTHRVQENIDFIKTLEPKPGRIFSSNRDTKYITPDVTVEKIDDEYVILVNDTTAPRLSVSPYYKRMLLSEEKNSKASQFLNGKLDSAMWLIKSIEQRRQTIFNVVKTIVNYQIDFFENGRKCLKPLTLKQIADEVGVHESTVSRAVNGKYMQSPMGVFEIKFFFNSGVSDDEGKGIAAESMKSMIREMIHNEDRSKPISDQIIANELKKQGINISRRTVAKYRDEMKIASSSKRKRF
ncbi:RNA polymerase factor sigma-54 [Lutibacter sp. B2]|nr:RNA polymerase factor sigma-54 [Lutibacter sp. B2]